MTRVDSPKLCSDGRVAGKRLCRAGITTSPSDFEWPVWKRPIYTFPDRGSEMERIVVSGGWPTFTPFVKVGTHAARIGIFDLCLMD